MNREVYFVRKLACGRQNSFTAHQHSVLICSAIQTVYRGGVRGGGAGLRPAVKNQR